MGGDTIVRITFTSRKQLKSLASDRLTIAINTRRIIMLLVDLCVCLHTR